MTTNLLVAVLTMTLAAEHGSGERVPVIVAKRQLPAGSVLTTDSVAMRPVPEMLVTASVVRPDSASYVIDQMIVEDVDAGVPLRWSMFAVGASEDEVNRCATMILSDSPPLALQGVMPSEGKTVRVLVARKDIEHDSPFEEAAFAALDIPVEYAGWHAVRAVDASKLKGQRILVPMLVGDPLYATQLAGKSEPKRCQLITEKMGNRFALGGPDDEAKVVACPKGTVARSGIPKFGEKVHRHGIGWIRFCERPSGVRHGPFAFWNREGYVQLKGAFGDGVPHGRWESLDGQGTAITTVEFRKGLRHGKYQSGPAGDYLSKGQYESNVRQGEWHLGDGKRGRRASGRFEAGRFVGKWAFETDEKTRELVFENGKPKGPKPEEATVPIIILAKALKAGEKVTEEHLSTVALPGWAANGHFVDPASAHFLVGVEASFSLEAGAALLWDDFDSPWDFDVTEVVLETGKKR